MKRLLINIILLVVLATSVLNAQGFSRRLNIFTDFASGSLIPTKEEPLMNGNEYIFGIGYSQNFEQAPWLTFMLSGAIKSTALMQYNDKHTIIGMRDYRFYNGYDFLIGLNFGGYVNLLVLESYDLVVEAMYPLQLPGAEHRLLFKAGLETFVLGYDAINTGDFVSAGGGYQPVSDGFSAEQRKFYIDVFQLILNYNIRFSPQWFYETELVFKFKGTPILDGSAKKVVAAHDTAEAFKQNFHIIFANMIGYNHSSGLNLYAKIEYEIRDILKENASGQKLKTIHDLQFKGGVSYSFDFSRLNVN